MATIDSVTETTANGSTASHSVSVPTVSSGTLLLCIGAVGDTLAGHSGWTDVGSLFGIAVLARSATGSDSLTVTFSGATRAAWQVLAISDWSGGALGTVIDTATTFGDSTNPDPPSNSHAFTEALSVAVCARFSANAPSAAPSGYSGLDSAIEASSAHSVAHAYRDITSSPENPGVFTSAASEEWFTATIIIESLDVTDIPDTYLSIPVSFAAEDPQFPIAPSVRTLAGNVQQRIKARPAIGRWSTQIVELVQQLGRFERSLYASVQEASDRLIRIIDGTCSPRLRRPTREWLEFLGDCYTTLTAESVQVHVGKYWEVGPVAEDGSTYDDITFYWDLPRLWDCMPQNCVLGLRLVANTGALSGDTDDIIADEMAIGWAWATFNGGVLQRVQRFASIEEFWTPDTTDFGSTFNVAAVGGQISLLVTAYNYITQGTGDQQGLQLDARYGTARLYIENIFVRQELSAP